MSEKDYSIYSYFIGHLEGLAFGIEDGDLKDVIINDLNELHLVISQYKPYEQE